MKTPGRIQPTPATAHLFAQLGALRAEKFTHATLSPEWLRLGGEVCKLTEKIRKIVTEVKK
jgi:hypothetical protein